MQRVALVGYGITKFGRREASWRDLASEAGKACFESCPGVDRKGIDGVFVSTADEEPYLAAVAAENLGIKPRIATKIENLCSSGGTAITIASGLIQAGLVGTALVLGVEKMYHKKTVPLLTWDFTRGGILIPATWGAVYAQKHMTKFGTTEEQLARVSVKNHRNSSMNPHAHFQEPITLENVMNSKPIVTPLKLFDCSSRSDGAAAVILTSEEKARTYTDSPIWIVGRGESSQGATFGNINPLYVTWPAVVMAARQAYHAARVKPSGIQVAELHDAFTINEIIQYEDMGFCEKGKGGKFIEAGESEIGGKIAVNPSGGLLGRGHPIGATGVAQAVEIMQQLRGEAGKRQVSGAVKGLSMNLSASVSTASCIIYARD